jgi:hypothetical protein
MKGSRIIRACMVCVVFAAMVSVAYGQDMKSFAGEGYRITIPRSWQQQTVEAPSGTKGVLFVGSSDFGCSIESSPINEKLMPSAAGSTPEQRREFIMQDWNMQDWFAIFPNLASTKDFKTHVNTKTTLGKELPAAMLEYSWVNVEGIYCRARTIYAFTSKRQFSLNCYGFGLTAEKARQGFERNIALLQKVQYSFQASK